MLVHRVLFKRPLSPFIQVIWSGQVYRVIQLMGVIFLTEKECFQNSSVAPQCNPSIFTIVSLPSNNFLEESIPKDEMNWASIIGK